MRAARRGSPTGAKAVEIITKSDTVSYGAVGPPDTPYTPLRASLIAEPSRPQRVVPMLGALPPELSRYYSKESNVLRDPQPSNSVLNELRACSQAIGGERSEYIAYFRRPDVQPLWNWIPDGHQRACCSFKAVWKKNRKAQRKILPTLEANAMMEPPPRPYGLGLYAGASLGSVVLGEDRMFAAQFDQENCFTYVEIPEWLQLYFAAPRLRHWEAGGPRVTGLHNLSLRSWVRPTYRRLPMGSTLAVDIIFAINLHLGGLALFRSRAFHWSAVLQSGPVQLVKRGRDKSCRRSVGSVCRLCCMVKGLSRGRILVPHTD